MTKGIHEMASRLEHVLWLGGMSGVGKTTGARTVARRYVLRFYSIDSHTYLHAERTNPDRHPALASYSTLSLDQLWVDPPPEAIVERFVASAPERLELVIEDLLELPADAPILVEGPHLLPSLVAPLVASPTRTLYLVADPTLQRELIQTRGASVPAQTSAPERAHQNRLRRDELLAEQLQHEATELGFTVVEVDHPANTARAIESKFQPSLQAWLRKGARGDVAARRREDNDARLLQWRLHLHAQRVPAAGVGEVAFACECDRQGCAETVPLTLSAATNLRTNSERFMAHH
jgi:2-phosphoglycerate kinase